MGAAASKARSARRFDNSKKPPWAGARTPSSSNNALPTRPQASSSRTPSIDLDAHDPQLVQNLRKLGQVKVEDPNVQTFKPSTNNMTRMLASRKAAEVDTCSFEPTPNRIPSWSLSDLLDQRKSAKSTEHVRQLAANYGIDYDRLESISQFVNSPSVGSTSLRTVDKDGKESFKTQAIWVAPKLRGPTLQSPQ